MMTTNIIQSALLTLVMFLVMMEGESQILKGVLLTPFLPSPTVFLDPSKGPSPEVHVQDVFTGSKPIRGPLVKRVRQYQRIRRHDSQQNRVPVYNPLRSLHQKSMSRMFSQTPKQSGGPWLGGLDSTNTSEGMTVSRTVFPSTTTPERLNHRRPVSIQPPPTQHSGFIQSHSMKQGGSPTQVWNTNTNLTTHRDPLCGKLPSLSWECKAEFPRYFYNPDMDQCDCYFTGGCDPNDLLSSYQTLEECRHRCHPQNPQEGPNCGRIFNQQLSTYLPPTPTALPFSHPKK